MKSFMEYVKDSNTGKKASNMSVSNVTSQLLTPTGFMYADFMNGGNLVVYDDDENPITRYNNIGVLNGSLNTLISKSNVGKTTYAIQASKGMLETWLKSSLLHSYIREDLNPKYKYDLGSMLHICDSEKTLDISNVKRLTLYPNSILKKLVTINHITTDKELIEVVEKHIKYKIDNMEKIYYPVRDIYGEYIYNYPLTVLIIDSLNKIQDVDGIDMKDYERATNNTAGARRARVISALLSILVNYAKYYNINIIMTGHINIAPQMSVMPQAKQYHGLRVGETISGGEKAIYLASNITRMDRVKDVGGEKSSALNWGDGVEGSIVRCTNIKSKTNKFSAYCHHVYLNEVGYDPLYSTMYEAMVNGDIEKSGNFYILDKRPDVKFNMKNFQEKFSDDITLLYDFYDQITKKASRLLSTVKENEDKNMKKVIAESSKDEFPDADESVLKELDQIYSDITKTVYSNKLDNKDFNKSLKNAYRIIR